LAVFLVRLAIFEISVYRLFFYLATLVKSKISSTLVQLSVFFLIKKKRTAMKFAGLENKRIF